MPDSVQKQFEDYAVTTIQSLSLSWPPSAQIRAARLPYDVLEDGTVVIHPGITVYELRATEAPGSNQREDVGYGIGIAFIHPKPHNNTTGRDRIPAAKEAVRRKLQHDRPSITLTGGHSIELKVTDGEVKVPGKGGHRYEICGLVVRAWMRESRT